MNSQKRESHEQMQNILTRSEALQEEIPQKSPGAIPKVREPTKVKGNALSTEKYERQGLPGEDGAGEFNRSSLNLDVDQVVIMYHELCLGKNVFEERSDSTVWLRKVLGVAPDVDISLEFCKMNLEKNISLATNALLAFFSQIKLQREEAAKEALRQLKTGIPVTPINNPRFESLGRPFPDIFQKSVCKAIQLKDPPTPRSIKKRQPRQRENHKEKPNEIAQPQAEIAADSSYTTPSESHLQKKTTEVDNYDNNITQADPCTDSNLTKDGKGKTLSDSSKFPEEDAVLENTPSAPLWPQLSPAQILSVEVISEDKFYSGDAASYPNLPLTAIRSVDIDSGIPWDASCSGPCRAGETALKISAPMPARAPESAENEEKENFSGSCSVAASDAVECAVNYE